MAGGPERVPDGKGSDAPVRAASSKVGAFSVSLFLFALLLFLPPMVTLGEGPADLFGVPRVFAVLFSIWVGVIVLVYLIAERVGRPGS